jgi:hypothetical protein
VITVTWGLKEAGGGITRLAVLIPVKRPANLMVHTHTHAALMKPVRRPMQRQWQMRVTLMDRQPSTEEWNKANELALKMFQVLINENLSEDETAVVAQLAAANLMATVMLNLYPDDKESAKLQVTDTLLPFVERSIDSMVPIGEVHSQQS